MRGLRCASARSRPLRICGPRQSFKDRQMFIYCDRPIVQIEYRNQPRVAGGTPPLFGGEIYEPSPGGCPGDRPLESVPT